jgi:hypothetical protein
MPRQLYGLGSLVKSITKPFKKVAKGVKSFAKSDIGKLALTAGALYGLGGGFGAGGFKFGNLPGASFFGKGSINPLLSGTVKQGAKQFAPSAFANFLKSPSGIISALSIPSLLAAGQVPEMEGFGRDKEALARYLRRYYSNLNQDATDEEIEEFVRTNMAKGGDTAEENAIQASGIMDLPLNKNPAGVTELDLRETGGFIPPVGVKEKADDIPAMLSNNEFVFTADAVRGMGGGDVDKGAERMYAMMKTLENGGRV